MSDIERGILRFLERVNCASAQQVIRKMKAADRTLSDEDVVAALYTLRDRAAVEILPDWKVSLPASRVERSRVQASV